MTLNEATRPTSRISNDNALGENTDTTGGDRPWATCRPPMKTCRANEDFTYLITGGADLRGVFNITGGNVLEMVHDGVPRACRDGKSSYQVQIQVTDDGAPNLSYTETLTIFVNDLNENPTDIASSNVEQLARREQPTPPAASRWATCLATDEDLPGDNFDLPDHRRRRWGCSTSPAATCWRSMTACSTSRDCRARATRSGQIQVTDDGAPNLSSIPRR